MQDMSIPVIRGRGPRLMSIEQEVAAWPDGESFSDEDCPGHADDCENNICECWACVNDCGCRDGEIPARYESGGTLGDIAYSLNQAGVSPDASVYDYAHGDTAPNREQHSRVETDSSCGGEIIHAYLRLWEPIGAERFSRAIEIVRASRVDTDYHCGAHVHVDLSGEHSPAYGMQDAVSLVVLWNHLEDVLFRIASVGEVNRTARTGYANETYKHDHWHGPTVLRRLASQRGALNLGNYLESWRGCECGATRYGLHTECQCEPACKRTVEYRVWDGTTDPRRIRAYMALSLALTEYARGKTLSPRRLPAFGWSNDRWPSVADAAKVTTRMRFVMESLPLTDSERADIRYCVERYAGGEALRPALAMVARKAGSKRRARVTAGAV